MSTIFGLLQTWVSNLARVSRSFFENCGISPGSGSAFRDVEHPATANTRINAQTMLESIRRGDITASRSGWERAKRRFVLDAALAEFSY
jgi:hypothetical protein